VSTPSLRRGIAATFELYEKKLSRRAIPSLKSVCASRSPGDDLATLDETVRGRFRAEVEAERTEHVESHRTCNCRLTWSSCA
jgi:hypothetical protein